MNKVFFILVATCAFMNAHGQFIHKIKADSVLITNDSCTAELNLENSTKHINGFLYNKGNGRTEFRKVVKLNDSTVIIGEDTIAVLGNFKNGLTRTDNTVKLGGALTEPTIITASGTNILNITGSTNGPLLNVKNNGTGYAIIGDANLTPGTGIQALTGTGIGVYAFAQSTGRALHAISGSGLSVFGSSTLKSFEFETDHFLYPGNDVRLVGSFSKYSTSSPNVPAAGYGGALDFNLSSSTSNKRQAARLVWKWVDGTDATRTSSLEFWNLNNAALARKMAIAGNGQMTLDGYPGLPAQTDTAANKPLAIDGSGNVVKMASWTGGGSGMAILLKDSATNIAQLDIILNPATLGTYDRIEIQIEKCRPATDNTDLQLRFSSDNGASFNNGVSDYEWISNWNISNGTSGTHGVNGQTSDSKISITQNVGNNTAYSCNGSINLYHPFDNSLEPLYDGHLISNSFNSGNLIKNDVGGRRKAAQSTNAVRLFFNSGNIAKIKYRVIGYKN